MMNFSCIVVLQIAATMGQAQPDSLSYDAAYRQSTVSGRPLVVFVTADWCAACQRMKATTLSKMRRNGQLNNVEFTVVDFDRQRELASKLVQGGPIPQLIRYDRDKRTWQVRRLVGAKDVAEVTRFLRPNLARFQVPAQPARNTKTPNRAAAAPTTATQSR